jgi:hypothetical protein
MRDNDAVDVIRRLKLIKANMRRLETALDTLVGQAGHAIRMGWLDVRALAVEDKIQACYLLRAAGITPNLREAHRRVTSLLKKAKARHTARE